MFLSWGGSAALESAVDRGGVVCLSSSSFSPFLVKGELLKGDNLNCFLWDKAAVKLTSYVANNKAQ